MLEILKAMLHLKRSKEYYATELSKKFNTTVTTEQVSELISEIKGKNSKEVVKYIDESFSAMEDLAKGISEKTFNSDVEIRDLDQLIRVAKIDVDKWEITKWVQNYWGNAKHPHWQVKVWLSPKEAEFADIFIEFLKNYKPSASPVRKASKSTSYPNTCLVINKQDAHLNKYSIDGDNNIQERFSVIEERVTKILRKASLSSNLSKVIYILGSDEFNSEFTGTTFRGTPQENLMPYEESFELICNHEVSIITKLLEFTDDLEVMYIPGNHDPYVGFHMVSWLKAYFRKQANLMIDANPDFTKYVKFSNTAMMFNHGDIMKPEKLAQNFPIEYKEHWSSCDHYLIFTGDKHTELSRDIGGIKFYRIPALSKSKSRWDVQNGYTTTKAQMTAFLIEENNGLSDVYKETI